MGLLRNVARRSDAARLFDLVTRQAAWVHRRVDRTDLEAGGETTRHMSFDLTVPADRAVRHGAGLVLPLTLMGKTPLRRLDTCGPDGRPIPVLGRDDNGALVTAMIVEALGRAAPGRGGPLLEPTVRAAVMEDSPGQVASRVAALVDLFRDVDGHDRRQLDAVLALAEDLTHQFLFAVLVPFDHVDERIVVKVSVAEALRDFGRWPLSRDGRSTDLALSLADSAASAHFEVRAPLGLRVAGLTLLDQFDSVLAPPGPAAATGRTVHLTGLQALAPSNGTGVRARVELSPVAGGLVAQTALATCLVCLLFFTGLWQSESLGPAIEENRAGPVAAAALAAPALFLSVQARRPEHAWVARALLVPRSLNIATALVLYTTAVCLVTVSAGAAVYVLLAAFALQALISLAAFASWRGVSVEQPRVADTNG